MIENRKGMALLTSRYEKVPFANRDGFLVREIPPPRSRVPEVPQSLEDEFGPDPFARPKIVERPTGREFVRRVVGTFYTGGKPPVARLLSETSEPTVPPMSFFIYEDLDHICVETRPDIVWVENEGPWL